MSEETSPELSPLTAAIAAHIRDFHAGLPAEEQALLERVFALAEGAAANDETQGYALNAYMKLDGQAPALPALNDSFFAGLRPLTGFAMKWP